MPKRTPEKRSYWRRMLLRQQKSGQSIRRFCRDLQLSEPSFHYWKGKIGAGDRQTEATPQSSIPVQSREIRKENDAASVFIPVRLGAAASSVLEVVHPRGHVVRVPAVFDGECLRQVLQVLDGQGGT